MKLINLKNIIAIAATVSILGTSAAFAAAEMNLPVVIGTTGANAVYSGADASNSGQLTITNTAVNSEINYLYYNIAAGKTVHYDFRDNPGGFSLNRVAVGADRASHIYGNITQIGDGRVILLNPNGMLFANGASINLDSFYASTHTDFSNTGNLFTFETPTDTGIYVEDGASLTGTNNLHLVASGIYNAGTLATGNTGTLRIIAGKKYTANTISGITGLTTPAESVVFTTRDGVTYTPEVLIKTAATSNIQGGSVDIYSCVDEAYAGAADAIINLDGVITANHATVEDADLKIIAMGAGKNIVINNNTGLNPLTSPTLNAKDDILISTSNDLSTPGNIIIGDNVSMKVDAVGTYSEIKISTDSDSYNSGNITIGDNNVLSSSGDIEMRSDSNSDSGNIVIGNNASYNAVDYMEFNSRSDDGGISGDITIGNNASLVAEDMEFSAYSGISDVVDAVSQDAGSIQIGSNSTLTISDKLEVWAYSLAEGDNSAVSGDGGSFDFGAGTSVTADRMEIATGSWAVEDSSVITGENISPSTFTGFTFNPDITIFKYTDILETSAPGYTSGTSGAISGITPDAPPSVPSTPPVYIPANQVMGEVLASRLPASQDNPNEAVEAIVLNTETAFAPPPTVSPNQSGKLHITNALATPPVRQLFPQRFSFGNISGLQDIIPQVPMGAGLIDIGN